MKICYISSYCEDDIFNYQKNNRSSVNHAIQKFNGLLISGLCKHENIELDLFSIPDFNRLKLKKVPSKIRRPKIKYAPNIRIPGIKHFFVMLSSFFHVICQPKKSIIIFDVLKVSALLGGYLASKIRNFRTIGIVTDLPKYQSISKNKIMLIINNWLIKQMKSYVFLSKEMNPILNPNKKPFTIIEGFVNSDMQEYNHYAWSENEKIVLYAGNLDRKYGIDKLIDAFNLIFSQNEKLWIFGDGDYSGKLIEICKTNDNIKYYGVRPNSEIIQAELKSTVLVNPRPGRDDYTRFSFPSKTLEYLSTGTPVLMHKLPGISNEYDQYLNYFRDDNIENMAYNLRILLDMPIYDLKSKGELAKKFVMSEKNEFKQTQKLLDMIRGVL